MEVHTDLLVELVRQTGGVIIAVIAAMSAVAGLIGRMMWERSRNGGGQTRRDGQAQADGLHVHIASILEEQRKLYEGVIAEQRRLHEERTQRIAELTAELHEVREELRHLYRVLQEHGIQAPPRAVEA